MITLHRTHLPSQGTVGVLELQDTLWYTMEQPWRNNLPFKSCIPVGEYQLIPWESYKYGECFIAVNEELNVFHSEASPGRPSDGRFKCLYFHRGNYPNSFKGCGGIGYSYKPSLDMITNTRKACKIVNKTIHDEGSYILRIKDL